MIPLILTDRLLLASRGLVLRTCDEGVLVFDEKNGKTSLLNHQAGFVLTTLSAGNGVEEAVLQRAFSMKNESDISMFNRVISSLQDAGFVTN